MMQPILENLRILWKMLCNHILLRISTECSYNGSGQKGDDVLLLFTTIDLVRDIFLLMKQLAKLLSYSAVNLSLLLLLLLSNVVLVQNSLYLWCCLVITSLLFIYFCFIFLFSLFKQKFRTCFIVPLLITL